MRPVESSPRIPPRKPTFACVRCFERKVRCDKQNPCSACVRQNVQCIFRPPKQSKRRQLLASEDLVNERLRRYEALLREKGIDPNQVPGPSLVEQPRDNSQFGISGPLFQQVVSVSRPLSAIFKPQLVQGQKGTSLVDKYEVSTKSDQ
jgi:hypothetical protein